MEKKPEINLIDREAAAEILDARAEMAVGTPGIVFNAAAKIVRALPAIDAAPVRHARWVWDNDAIDWNIGSWVCSDCKQRNENIHAGMPGGYVGIRSNTNIWAGSNYCPNCGAKMDLEE